ncbi:MAG: ATP-binding cassette domain-containing protein [Pseudomonadota bacterium]
MADDLVCSMEEVRFRYREDADHQFILDQLSVRREETVLLTGESGAGKSTVLGLLCGVLAASAGSIMVGGHTISGQSGSKRDRIRADHIGYIFQSANLLPYLSPTDNVLLAGQFAKARAGKAGTSPDARRAHAEALLDRLGVGSITRSASTLSVGQQQRVAAARALFGSPDLLVADEPTAALDNHNRDRFFELFLSEAKKNGAGALVVSHDTSVVPLFDRHIDLRSLSRWEAS